MDVAAPCGIDFNPGLIQHIQQEPFDRQISKLFIYFFKNKKINIYLIYKEYV